MEIFQSIRLKVGKLLLARKTSSLKRRKYYSNISMVRKIGIVWDASKPVEFGILSRFHQKMHNRGIDVMILGYYPEKELPDRYTAQRYLSVIRSTELSYFYIPVSRDATDFIAERFDVLIDINSGSVFPLQYILEMSQAGFKVGLYKSSENDSPFDMMMDIKSPVDIESYLNDVVEYLEMINSEKSKIV
ncbi:MAG TPA: hypothetical protein VJ963_12435 [Bacteroidales bacterium]|nr:hypothetical protein [Bacteroidales bacterium]